MSKWISVEKSLPEACEIVLCFGPLLTDLGLTFLTWPSYHDGDKWREIGTVTENNDGWTITHWMPLPEPPQ